MHHGLSSSLGKLRAWEIDRKGKFPKVLRGGCKRSFASWVQKTFCTLFKHFLEFSLFGQFRPAASQLFLFSGLTFSSFERCRGGGRQPVSRFRRGGRQPVLSDRRVTRCLIGRADRGTSPKLGGPRRVLSFLSLLDYWNGKNVTTICLSRPLLDFAGLRKKKTSQGFIFFPEV